MGLSLRGEVRERQVNDALARVFCWANRFSALRGGRSRNLGQLQGQNMVDQQEIVFAVGIDSKCARALHRVDLLFSKSVFLNDKNVLDRDKLILYKNSGTFC